MSSCYSSAPPGVPTSPGFVSTTCSHSHSIFRLLNSLIEDPRRLQGFLLPSETLHLEPTEAQAQAINSCWKQGNHSPRSSSAENTEQEHTTDDEKALEEPVRSEEPAEGAWVQGGEHGQQFGNVGEVQQNGARFLEQSLTVARAKLLLSLVESALHVLCAIPKASVPIATLLGGPDEVSMPIDWSTAALRLISLHIHLTPLTTLLGSKTEPTELPLDHVSGMALSLGCVREAVRRTGGEYEFMEGSLGCKWAEELTDDELAHVFLLAAQSFQGPAAHSSYLSAKDKLRLAQIAGLLCPVMHQLCCEAQSTLQSKSSSKRRRQSTGKFPFQQSSQECEGQRAVRWRVSEAAVESLLAIAAYFNSGQRQADGARTSWHAQEREASAPEGLSSALSSPLSVPAIQLWVALSTAALQTSWQSGISNSDPQIFALICPFSVLEKAGRAGWALMQAHCGRASWMRAGTLAKQDPLQGSTVLASTLLLQAAISLTDSEMEQAGGCLLTMLSLLLSLIPPPSLKDIGDRTQSKTKTGAGSPMSPMSLTLDLLASLLFRLLLRPTSPPSTLILTSRTFSLLADHTPHPASRAQFSMEVLQVYIMKDRSRCAKRGGTTRATVRGGPFRLWWKVKGMGKCDFGAGLIRGGNIESEDIQEQWACTMGLLRIALLGLDLGSDASPPDEALLVGVQEITRIVTVAGFPNRAHPTSVSDHLVKSKSNSKSKSKLATLSKTSSPKNRMSAFPSKTASLNSPTKRVLSPSPPHIQGYPSTPPKSPLCGTPKSCQKNLNGPHIPVPFEKSPSISSAGTKLERNAEDYSKNSDSENAETSSTVLQICPRDVDLLLLVLESASGALAHCVKCAERVIEAISSLPLCATPSETQYNQGRLLIPEESFHAEILKPILHESEAMLAEMVSNGVGVEELEKEAGAECGKNATLEDDELEFKYVGSEASGGSLGVKSKQQQEELLQSEGIQESLEVIQAGVRLSKRLHLDTLSEDIFGPVTRHEELHTLLESTQRTILQFCIQCHILEAVLESLSVESAHSEDGGVSVCPPSFLSENKQWLESIVCSQGLSGVPSRQQVLAQAPSRPEEHIYNVSSVAAVPRLAEENFKIAKKSANEIGSERCRNEKNTIGKRSSYLKRRKSSNPFIDAALVTQPECWSSEDDDDYDSLEDFIVCKPGRDYTSIFKHSKPNDTIV